MKRQRDASYNAIQMLHQRGVTGGRALRKRVQSRNPEDGLAEWAETELLRHCSSTYCNNSPPLPRSTIALAFSPDGKLLASTHGDHTVKITCCRTGSCLRVLRDHERTPWVVKFHPRDSNLLASGSLDSHVRVWDVPSGECLHSYNFGRPISSLDFHADGDELAVASGHRMYLWKYGAESVTAAQRLANRPVLMLKTRRSLRAVHFHPQGAPLILTAEVSSGHKSSRNPMPLDLTGVVNGVETDERRHRHRPRAHTANRERSQPRDSTVFGEQLSQALRDLQATHHSNVLQGGEAGPSISPSGPLRSALQQPHVDPEQLRSAEEETQAEAQQAGMWRELYARRILNPQERVTYPPGAPEWFNQSPFERFLDNRRRFRDLALDSQPEGSVHGPPAPPRSTLPPTGAEAEAAFLLSAAPVPAAGCGTSTMERLELEAARQLGAGGREQISRAKAYSPLPRRTLQGCAEASLRLDTAHPPVVPRSGGLEPSSMDPASAGRTSAIDNLVRLAELLEFETPEAVQCVTGGAGAKLSQPGDAGSARRSLRGSWRQGENSGAEAPQRVLQRISSSGGGGAGVNGAQVELAWPADLEEVIDGRWNGARPSISLVGRSDREHLRQRQVGSSGADELSLQGGHPVSRINGPRGIAVEGVQADVWPHPILDAVPVSVPRPATRQQPTTPPLPSVAAPAHPDSHSHGTPNGGPALGLARPASVRDRGVQATGGRDGEGRNGRDANGHTSRSAGKEVGCHVLVRLWRYDQEGGPHPRLGALKLAIHNTVLCSDMGLNISPCGRFLALCTSVQDEEVCEGEGDGSALQYELRIYSLAATNFGEVLQVRPIKAAHCLTAIQFSPASRHILLAYGRRDPSLQRNLNGDNLDSMVAVHTVLELYRVHDLTIVRLLPSADDEINTAVFHPFMGGGLAYGTKEGRLRILTHSSSPLKGSKHCSRSGGLEDELLAAQEASSHTSEEERDP